MTAVADPTVDDLDAARDGVGVDAERACLGGALWSPTAITEIVEIVDPEDWSQPKHATIAAAIAALADTGQVIEPTSVLAELERRGEMLRVGGAPYLHTLLAAGSPAYLHYARLVANRAHLRRIAQTGQRLQQLALVGDIDAPDEVLDRARADLDAVAERRRGRELYAFADLLNAAVDGYGDPIPPGLATPWPDLDEILGGGGLRAGALTIVGARPGVGKALALDTPLPTPTGWTTMGEVRVGERVLGADGRPTTVRAATDVMHERPCYEVHFSDGTVIVADADHQWLTETRAARRAAADDAAPRTSPLARDQRHKRATPAVVTTEHIGATLRCPTADARLNHAVAVTEPLQLSDVALPIHPYVLGVWLGDGSSWHASLTCADGEILLALHAAGQPTTRRASRYSYGLAGLNKPLRLAGLLQNKHIPAAYLRASESQRRELLAGLLDTDGTVTTGGGVQLAVTNQRLAEGALELVLSLGYRATMRTKRVRGRHEHTSTCYMLNFTPGDKVFKLSRKTARQTTRAPGARNRRYITDVRPVPSVPVRCIEVDNADHLYLASRAMIPTHNSVIAVNLARYAAAGGAGVLVASLEMPQAELMDRLVAAEGPVDYGRLRDHKLTEADWQAVDRAAAALRHHPIRIDDNPNATLASIRAAGRDMTRTPTGLGLLVIDYLQLIKPADSRQPRQEQVAAVARGCKLLARELAVPVVALSGINRGPTARASARPTMADLRESGEIENSADQIILLHRDDEKRGEIELAVVKNRAGRTGSVSLSWAGHYQRAASLSRYA